jgi:hypothetical protein
LQAFQFFWVSEKFNEPLKFLLWLWNLKRFFLPLKPSKFIGIVARTDSCGLDSIPSGGGAKGTPRSVP